ncbi:hypothetical protein Fmac_008361 [Flemingia macrophylla]|uniref:Uncharacterized protein n=1 Tax=Flemingia macrophylla TaxID=520843 RepID=A0ABD1MX69_9FABA
MASNSQQFSVRNDAIVIRGVHDVATDTSSKTRKLEGIVDALVNFMTQLAMDQMSGSFVRLFGIRSSNDHHANVCPSLQQSGVNDILRLTFIRGQTLDREDDFQILTVQRNKRSHYDVATDTSTETRKLECKVDALVSLETQLAVNQKSTSIARVFGICSSTDHHTNVCPSLQQS